MEPLIDRVIKCNKGCQVAGKCCAIFIYADDVILVSPTRGAMQILLNICDVFAFEYGLKFNLGKCKVILFLTSRREVLPLTLNDTQLEITDCDKHLGHVLNNNGDIINFAKIISDLKSKANVLCREFNFLDHFVKAKLFNVNCTSFYGISLLNLSSQQFEQHCVAWTVSI